MENVLLEALSYETHHHSGYYLLGTALERQKNMQNLGKPVTKHFYWIFRENVHYLYMQICPVCLSEDSCITKSLYPYFQKEASRQGMECVSSVVRRSRASEPKRD